MANLYIVATPIGNLGDITLRALETFRTVDIVACEDTRHTIKLLTHYGIKVKLLSCRSANENSAAQRVIAALDGGLNAAYASDAGTPAISDPGARLARLAVCAGHQVIPVPGASAFASIISVAGGLGKSVVFEGFLSPKAGRRKARLKELLSSESAFVLYESPFRIIKLFEDLADLDSERSVCVGREMTKVHEEYLRASVGDVLKELSLRKEQLGEFTIFISAKQRSDDVSRQCSDNPVDVCSIFAHNK
ncbi:MAG: 16S rRNA (cytidine(1402)-2'-O)-methyltransferase [Termitinemataceae bacterium]|nr:MAG: 16S rRNA (cytidine(1402)-2'-O)-methyltransferase [Termitinemataceae bacterium]